MTDAQLLDAARQFVTGMATVAALVATVRVGVAYVHAGARASTDEGGDRS